MLPLILKKKKALECRLTELLVWDGVKGFGKVEPQGILGNLFSKSEVSKLCWVCI